VSKNPQGMSFEPQPFRRKARTARGILGEAISAVRNAAPDWLQLKPSGRRRFGPWAALRPRAKAFQALAPRARLAQWPKIASRDVPRGFLDTLLYPADLF
jgi:hypothetical protein